MNAPGLDQEIKLYAHRAHHEIMQRLRRMKFVRIWAVPL